MVRKHSKYMLNIIKKRLLRPENNILLTYFKNDKLIKEVLESGVDDLLSLNKKICAFLELYHNKGDIKEAIIRTFSEKNFFSKNTQAYNAYHLCEFIGLKTCPYCNIISIPTIITKRPKRFVLRPPLDHFYPNSLYPLLAISFYNLIPCCDTCNSRLKLNKDTHHTTHLNPYKGEFANEYVFTLTKFKKIDDLFTKSSAKFTIKLENLTGDCRFDGNQKLFQLETIYSNYKENARLCLVKSRSYSRAALNSISKIVSVSDTTIYHHIFETNFELERLHENPLSKLKRDIIIKYSSKELRSKLNL